MTITARPPATSEWAVPSAPPEWSRILVDIAHRMPLPSVGASSRVATRPYERTTRAEQRSPSNATAPQRYRAAKPESPQVIEAYRAPPIVSERATGAFHRAHAAITAEFGAHIDPAKRFIIRITDSSDGAILGGGPGGAMAAWVNFDDPDVINVNGHNPVWLTRSLRLSPEEAMTHEMLHAYSATFANKVTALNSKVFGAEILYDIDGRARSSYKEVLIEGVTELYARRAGGLDERRTNSSYSDALRWANTLEARVGKETLARAYFQGDDHAIARVKGELAAMDLEVEQLTFDAYRSTPAPGRRIGESDAAWFVRAWAVGQFCMDSNLQLTDRELEAYSFIAGYRIDWAAFNGAPSFEKRVELVRRAIRSGLREAPQPPE